MEPKTTNETPTTETVPVEPEIREVPVKESVEPMSRSQARRFEIQREKKP